jgi:hypothetical protein
MVVLTDEEKRSILLRAQAKNFGYKGSERNRQELYAALMIIEKTLGKNWYQKATKPLDVKRPTIHTPRTYYHLLEEDTSPPLTRLLMGGQPSGIARIILFATNLQELEGTNVRDKIDDYLNQERRCDLSFDHFIRFASELKLAAVWKRLGLGVHFIRKQKTTTPDFELTSTFGKTYVECKRKDMFTKRQKELDDICRRVIVGVQNEMSRLRLNYSINVTFNKEPNVGDVSTAVSTACENLIQKAEHFIVNCGLITVEGSRLASYDVIHSSKEIPEEPSGSTLVSYHPSYECQEEPPQMRDLANLRRADLPIRNFKMVSVCSAIMPTILQSVINSVKDASAQLLESSGYGVVAIEIFFGRTPEAQVQLKQVVDNLPLLLIDMPYISAILLSLEEIFAEDGKLHLAARFLRFFNPSTSHKLPRDMEQIMRTDVPMPHKSLLD